jgi:hypothetical protein
MLPSSVLRTVMVLAVPMYLYRWSKADPEHQGELPMYVGYEEDP